MAKREPTALACPLCLGLDDPQSMVDVAIERTNPPDAVVVSLCRRCAYAVAKALDKSDQPPPPAPLIDMDEFDRERAARHAAADAASDPKKQDE